MHIEMLSMTAPPNNRLARGGRLAIYAYLLTMPWIEVLFTQLNGHDLARVAQVFLGALCTVILANLYWSWRLADSPHLRPAAGFAALIVLGSLAVAQAPIGEAAFKEAASWLGLIAVAWLLARTGPEDLVLEVILVVALSTGISIYMDLQTLLFSFANGVVLPGTEVGAGYINRRFLNHTETIQWPLLLVALTLSRRRMITWLAWFASVGVSCLLWRTGARGSSLALTVAMLCVPWLLGGPSRTFWLRTLKVIAFSGLFYVLIYSVLPQWFGWAEAPDAIQVTLGQRNTGNNVPEGRPFLWRQAVTDIQNHPWFGIGPMHFAHALTTNAHPHNIYLQFAAEWGIPFALALAMIVFSTLLAWCVDLRRLRDPSPLGMLSAGLLLAVVAGLLDAVVSGNLVMPVSQVWWFAAWGWGLASLRGLRDSIESPNSTPLTGINHLQRLPVRAAIVGLALIQMTFIWVTITDVTHMKLILRDSAALNPLNSGPRFWSSGWF